MSQRTTMGSLHRFDRRVASDRRVTAFWFSRHRFGTIVTKDIRGTLILSDTICKSEELEMQV